MKKIILFDIDYTLIDSDVIKSKTLEEIAKSCQVELLKLQEAKDKYYLKLKSTSDVDPDEMLGVMQKELRVPLANLKTAYYNPKIYNSAIYSDVSEFFKKVDKDNFDFGIFSEGQGFYQIFKIEASGLKDYFDKNLVWISRRKKSKEYIETLPKGSTVVDDKLDVANELAEIGWVTPVWLNRKDDRVNPKVKTIFKLTELLDPLVAAATDGD